MTRRSSLSDSSAHSVAMSQSAIAIAIVMISFQRPCSPSERFLISFM